VRRAGGEFRVEFEKIREPGAESCLHHESHCRKCFCWDAQGRSSPSFAYAMPAGEIIERIRMAHCGWRLSLISGEGARASPHAAISLPQQGGAGASLSAAHAFGKSLPELCRLQVGRRVVIVGGGWAGLAAKRIACAQLHPNSMSC